MRATARRHPSWCRRARRHRCNIRRAAREGAICEHRTPDTRGKGKPALQQLSNPHLTTRTTIAAGATSLARPSVQAATHRSRRPTNGRGSRTAGPCGEQQQSGRRIRIGGPPAVNACVGGELSREQSILNAVDRWRVQRHRRGGPCGARAIPTPPAPRMVYMPWRPASCAHRHRYGEALCMPHPHLRGVGEQRASKALRRQRVSDGTAQMRHPMGARATPERPSKAPERRQSGEWRPSGGRTAGKRRASNGVVLVCEYCVLAGMRRRASDHLGPTERPPHPRRRHEEDRRRSTSTKATAEGCTTHQLKQRSDAVPWGPFRKLCRPNRPTTRPFRVFISYANACKP